MAPSAWMKPAAQEHAFLGALSPLVHCPERCSSSWRWAGETAAKTPEEPSSLKLEASHPHLV